MIGDNHAGAWLMAAQYAACDNTKSISLEQRKRFSKMANSDCLKFSGMENIRLNLGKNAPADLREAYNRKEPKTQLKRYNEEHKRSFLELIRRDFCAFMTRVSHLLLEIFCDSSPWT
uniref:Uncharacterized protein n=1 Tax=Glossina pallidipes TaxID=7398 RepID=A0A1B0AJJ6_GLOPL